MVVVGAGMIILLRSGLWIAGKRAPAEIDDPFRIASILLISIVLASIVLTLRGGFKRLAKRRTDSAGDSAQPLASALLVNSDAICIHLQPIERAMRNFDVDIAQQPGRDTCADCPVNRTELASIVGAVASALYVERQDMNRSNFDPKTALFWCPGCNSRLWVVHADAAIEQTPWFPEHILQPHTSTKGSAHDFATADGGSKFNIS